MPPSDQEPRYQLVDSNGNVVGSLFGDGSGNVVIADETDTQTTFDSDGISTPTLEADNTNTKRLSDEHVYAGEFTGADADERLDAAISNSTPGDIIHLESETYATNRSITEKLRFVGTGGAFGGTFIDANWTVDTTDVIIESLRFAGGRTVTFNNDFCALNDCNNGGVVTVTVSANLIRVTNSQNLDVTFESGNSAGLVDSCLATTATDNDGGNTIGDLS